MIKLIITCVDKKTGQRYVFHEQVKHPQNVRRCVREMMKMSPGLRVIKWTQIT